MILAATAYILKKLMRQYLGHLFFSFAALNALLAISSLYRLQPEYRYPCLSESTNYRSSSLTIDSRFIPGNAKKLPLGMVCAQMRESALEALQPLLFEQ
jgi:hypothetical protein